MALLPTGVDGFMKAAGVTSGAFYSHFSCKQDLLKALIRNRIATQFCPCGKIIPIRHVAEWVDFELDRYLTPSHLKHADQGCVLPTLASEVARANDDIKYSL